MKRPILAKGTIARTLGNKITYFDGGYYAADFSAASPDVQSVFVHEIAHVWQHNNVADYSAAAAGMEHIRFKDPYAYTFNAGQSFTSYRYEQQGAIMEHYSYARLTGASMVRGVAIQSYENMIFNSITNIYRSP